MKNPRFFSHPVMDALVVAVIMVLLLSSCHRNDDPLFGRWVVEKVNVEFDENKSTPEMVRQYGEMERGNVIEIGKDSSMIFISDGDTSWGKIGGKGEALFYDGVLFGQFKDGVIITETSTPIGKVRVSYKKDPLSLRRGVRGEVNPQGIEP
ncbi:MAG: hypothetical protein IKM99_06705 [Bacteroidales bacterium]|nr:hypothetical protein [Bacteroidales bacterium]